LAIDKSAQAALTETQAAFNAAASYCASVAWEQAVTNKNKLHKLVYRATREQFGLGAQLACCARDKAAEAVRAARSNKSDTCPVFGADSSIRYDARTYRLMSLDRVSLNTIQGRVVGQLVLGEYQRTHLYDTTWKIGGAELIRRDGVWYLHITQTKASPTPDEPTGVVGVDLGIVNLASDSDGEQYSGEQVKQVRERRFKHRQRLQKCNTRRARYRLRQLARKEARFAKDTNHVISKSLVEKARRERKALALEDLTNIRKRVTVRKAQRREHSSWAFAQLRMFIVYKAALAGVPVQFVCPRNTSRTCSVCGHCDKHNRRSQGHFQCLSCGHTANADTNAAINISRAAVTQPIVLRPAGEERAQAAAL
jgi:IS605 OrfB family transposase